MPNDTTSTTAQAPSGFVLPTKAELAQARANADKARNHGEDEGLKPGRVVDLDYGQWAAAIVDLSEKPDRVEHNRRRHAAKGYVKVGGNPIVMGFPKAEVWVISREDYERNRALRLDRITKAVEDGEMSETALSVETVRTPRRKRP